MHLIKNCIENSTQAVQQILQFTYKYLTFYEMHKYHKIQFLNIWPFNVLFDNLFILLYFYFLHYSNKKIWWIQEENT